MSLKQYTLLQLQISDCCLPHCNSRWCLWFQIIFQIYCFSLIAETKTIYQDVLNNIVKGSSEVHLYSSSSVEILLIPDMTIFNSVLLSVIHIYHSFHIHHQSLVYLCALTVRKDQQKSFKGTAGEETVKKQVWSLTLHFWKSIFMDQTVYKNFVTKQPYFYIHSNLWQPYQHFQ